VLMWRAAPETKGKTLEEIEALWLTAPGSAGTANTAAALRE
jgi:hypothetical protein